MYLEFLAMAMNRYEVQQLWYAISVWHQYANLVFSIHLDFKDYMICLAGSRSDLIPVQAVQVSVEATGELAAQRYEYRQLKSTWLHEDPTDKPLSNPRKNWQFP